MRFPTSGDLRISWLKSSHLSLSLSRSTKRESLVLGYSKVANTKLSGIAVADGFAGGKVSPV